MRNIVLSVLSVVFVFSSAEGVSACWCRREALDTEERFRAAVAKEFRIAGAVFIGEVIEQKRSRIKIKVERVWKGEIADEVILITHSWDDGDVGSIDSCAYPFAVGGKYLIYARKSGGELGASKCSRTQLSDKAGRDVSELERLKSKSRK